MGAGNKDMCRSRQASKPAISRGKNQEILSETKWKIMSDTQDWTLISICVICHSNIHTDTPKHVHMCTQVTHTNSHMQLKRIKLTKTYAYFGWHRFSERIFHLCVFFLIIIEYVGRSWPFPHTFLFCNNSILICLHCGVFSKQEA